MYISTYILEGARVYTNVRVCVVKGVVVYSYSKTGPARYILTWLDNTRARM